MKKVGFVGLGDMGMGMAKNILKAGFDIKGYDLREDRRENFVKAGGKLAESTADTARDVDVLFIMVMNGEHVDGVLADVTDVLTPGSTVFITATIGPWFIQRQAKPLEERGIHVVDMPVSGGRFRSNDGTLSLMAAGDAEVISENMDVLRAIGDEEKIYHVGSRMGDGQMVKLGIQLFMGSTYEGLFEAMVLAEKAELDLNQFAKVLNESIIGSALTKNTTEKIINRKFVDTGSHIATMKKDITLSVEIAKQLGVPAPCAVVSREMFQAGINVMPGGDNWSIVKLIEKMSGIERND
ncbi:MAG: NAD(P)-dependent oxidoreductase [Eubacteriales bacterium]|nr:NAD(P)-dependent oxidoreductase [Eubacteriales bacterium]